MLLCWSSTTFFSILLFLCFSTTIHGWGEDGHALVARIAQTLLTDEATTFVRNHLPANVSGNLSMVASWADNLVYPDTDPDYRNWLWSKPLHYVDTKDWSCVYDRQNDCNWTSPNGQRCVDGAIQNYTLRLADSQQDPIQRQQALMFIIHFIGDAHQPLHAGFKGDLGGNEIHGQFCDERTELHAVWDTKMIERRISQTYSNQPALYLAYLLDQLNTKYAQNISDWTQCRSSDESRFLACSTSWIMEDAKLNCEVVYRDENDQPMSRSTQFHLCDRYFDTRMVILEQRLLQAGVRLATVINKIVNSTSTNHDKSNRICGGTMILMVLLFSQCILLLALLYYSVVQRETPTRTEPNVIEEKKEYYTMA